jgi:hypothetical protein
MGTDLRSAYVRLKVHQRWTYEVSRCHALTNSTIKPNVAPPGEGRYSNPSAVFLAEPTAVQTLKESWTTDHYLLTELSPSWEAANCAATQESYRLYP